MQEFIDFLNQEDLLASDLAFKTKVKLSKLRKNMKRQSGSRRAEAKESERDKRITEDDILTFYESEVVKKCIKMLNSKPDLLTVKGSAQKVLYKIAVKEFA